MAVNAVQMETSISVDNLQSLEEKVLKTIELLKTAREAKANVERDLARVREEVGQHEEEIQTLREENVALRKEREEIRGRVEKMLRQIEALAEAE